MGSRKPALEIFRRRLDAICCTHSHWDHCNLETLVWFDKNTPLLIPTIERPTAMNPPMKPVLKLLGFSNIVEVKHWRPEIAGDLEVVPTPFYGEPDEPGAEIDHYTHVLRTAGLTVYGGVDSYRDAFGDMESVVERVGRQYKPDVAFVPVSRVVYHYRYGSLNGFCRYLDENLLGASFQYTAGPKEAAGLSQRLGARLLVPYATFGFTRWADRVQALEFGAALREKGLSDRFYPLRPLDSIGAEDIAGMSRSRRRREMLLAWHHGISALRRAGQIAGFFPARETIIKIARAGRRYLATPRERS